MDINRNTGLQLNVSISITLYNKPKSNFMKKKCVVGLGVDVKKNICISNAWESYPVSEVTCILHKVVKRKVLNVNVIKNPLHSQKYNPTALNHLHSQNINPTTFNRFENAISSY